MSGAPRAMYAPQSFIILNLDAVEALGSWEAAGIWQRICWRAERDGYWRATMGDIAAEVRLSERTANRHTKKLREMGWLTAEREDAYDSTLTWRPVFDDDTTPPDTPVPAGQARDCQVGSPDDDNLTSPGTANLSVPGPPDLAVAETATVAVAGTATVAVPSIQTGKTTTETNNPSSAADAATVEPTGTASTDEPVNEAAALAAKEGEHHEAITRLCDHLAARIVDNGSKAPTVGKRWRDAARLMMTADGRTEAQIARMIDWCQADGFWRSNILSMPTLREKYDQMRLRAQEEYERGQRRTPQHHTSPNAANRGSVTSRGFGGARPTVHHTPTPEGANR